RTSTRARPSPRRAASTSTSRPTARPDGAPRGGYHEIRPALKGRPMPNIGPAEIIIVLVIVLLIFGPKRLPDLGRSLGRGMREFKDSVTGKDDDKQLEEQNAEQAAPVAPAEPVATTADEEARAKAARPADAS